MSSKRLPLHIDRQGINQVLKEAEATLDLIKQARLIVEGVTGKAPRSLTGVTEFEKYLKNDAFPKASASALADLNGCSAEYHAFRELLPRISDVNRFKLVDGGPMISDQYQDELTDQHTAYIEGDEIELYHNYKELIQLRNNLNEKMGAALNEVLKPSVGDIQVNNERFMFLIQQKRRNQTANRK